MMQFFVMYICCVQDRYYDLFFFQFIGFFLYIMNYVVQYVLVFIQVCDNQCLFLCFWCFVGIVVDNGFIQCYGDIWKSFVFQYCFLLCFCQFCFLVVIEFCYGVFWCLCVFLMWYLRWFYIFKFGQCFFYILVNQVVYCFLQFWCLMYNFFYDGYIGSIVCLLEMERLIGCDGLQLVCVIIGYCFIVIGCNQGVCLCYVGIVYY